MTLTVESYLSALPSPPPENWRDGPLHVVLLDEHWRYPFVGCVLAEHPVHRLSSSGSVGVILPVFLATLLVWLDTWSEGSSLSAYDLPRTVDLGPAPIGVDLARYAELAALAWDLAAVELVPLCVDRARERGVDVLTLISLVLEITETAQDAEEAVTAALAALASPDRARTAITACAP